MKKWYVVYVYKFHGDQWFASKVIEASVFNPVKAGEELEDTNANIFKPIVINWYEMPPE